MAHDPACPNDIMVTHAKLFLSVQRALLGAIPLALRAVACGWQKQRITLRFIFDGPIASDDDENMRIVATEVIADFQAPMTLDEQIIRIDYPASLSRYALQGWAYFRKEPTSG